MSKVSKLEVNPEAEDVEIVGPEETQALVQRAAMGEFLDQPGGRQKLFSPQFINVSKDSGDARIGKEKFDLLRCNQVTECIIMKIDGLGFMRSEEGNPMGAPIKYGNREAALDAGEIIDWPPKGVEGPRPTVAPYRDFAVLVKAPGDGNPAFGVSLPDGDYAPGIYSCGRTGYYQNCPQDEGILKTIRFELKNGTKLYQLVWNVQAVLHQYPAKNGQAKGFTSGYLKFSLKRRMKTDDPVFVAISDAMNNLSA
jgi:hypothetical protein